MALRHQQKLQERGLADEAEGPLAVGDPRQLDEDVIHALPLDERLTHPELVDAVADDLDGGRGDVLVLHRGRHLARVDPQHEVHAALEIQPKADALLQRKRVPCRQGHDGERHREAPAQRRGHHAPLPTGAASG